MAKRSPNKSTSSPSNKGTKRTHQASPSRGSTSRATKKKKATTTKVVDNGATTAANVSVTFPPPRRILIVDNGGDTLKYGWITDKQPQTPLPNLSARLRHQFTGLVGDELSTVQNPNSLVLHTHSTERGIITNMENQTKVWKRMLDLLGVYLPINQTEASKVFGWNISASRRGKKAAAVAAAAAAASDTTIPAHTVAVILLLPPHCPRLVLDQILQIWFEDFGVSHVGLGISSVCASQDQTRAIPWKTSCTVDLGWSSTLIVPTFKGQIIAPNAMRRLPLGGRHMINMLKYYMSYRQYNLMDQTHLLPEIFEKLSYVTLDMKSDMVVARKNPSGRRIYDRDYILPDYQRTHHGEIRIPPPLQRDLEREVTRKQKEGAEQEEMDEDEEDDEDFELNEEDDEDGDDIDMDDSEDEKTRTKASRQGKRNKKTGKVEDDVDGEDDDDEAETLEKRRKQILQERAEEERKRRLQQEEEQVLRISVERFAVPEVLFRPWDALLQSDLVGLAHAIVQSVEACPFPYRPALYQSIYLVGGLAQLKNLQPRLEREVRSLMPSEFKMNITLAKSPSDRAWFGAQSYFQTTPYTKWSVSRQEWEATTKRKAYSKLLVGQGGYYV